MFPFITDTWNPLGGECPHNCKGCWAKAYINRIKMAKYHGPYTLDKKQINKKFKPGSFVFVCDMLDLFAQNVPMVTIQTIMNRIEAQPEVTFLLLTRNPRYMWLIETPKNCIVGATIETDINYSELTNAPSPRQRILAMRDIVKDGHNRVFVCIEPIKKFNEGFEELIIPLKPWAVAIGYDNYHNHFPEPSLAETLDLIAKLEAAGITVYRKTLREKTVIENCESEKVKP
jgi:DNA repair photolyase